MKILYVSDIHTEFDNHPLLPEVDVIVLAGDIGSWERKLELISYLKYVSTRAKHVIYVLGNHEYYGTSIDIGLGKIEQLIVDAKLHNIHLLDMETYTIVDNHRKITFHGSTMWTSPSDDMEYAMNDYCHIGGYQEDVLIPDDIRDIHSEHQEWLEQSLKDDTSDIKIVVTHHMPYLTTKKDLHTYLSGYCADLTSIIASQRPQYWIYGHTHISDKTIISDTTCLSNPHGYPNELAYSHQIIDI